jgi:trehalose-phosphatase
MRRMLAGLAEHPRVDVCVISGRNQSDVRSRVRIPKVRCLGLHGWEGRGDEAIPAETREILESLKPMLRQALQREPQVWLEDKGMVIAVHYAYASPSGVERARSVVMGAVAPWNGRFRTVAGERQVEIAPTEVGDKGAAALREWQALGRRSLPIFIGDDVVDEPAFEALASGITIRVSRTAATAAHFRVAGVRQVQAFLHRLQMDLVAPASMSINDP